VFLWWRSGGGEGAENNLLAKLSAKLSNFNSTDETEDGFL